MNKQQWTTTVTTTGQGFFDSQHCQKGGKREEPLAPLTSSVWEFGKFASWTQAAGPMLCVGLPHKGHVSWRLLLFTIISRV